MADYPEQLYSFTDFSSTRPSEQIPGDRLDAQFENHRRAIQNLAQTVSQILTGENAGQFGLLTRADLTQTLVSEITAQVLARLQPGIDATINATKSLSATETRMRTLRDDIRANRTLVDEGLKAVTAASGTAFAQALKAAADVSRAVDHFTVLKTDLDNAERDAEGSAELAGKYAQLSQAWAEYLDGNNPIPPDLLAVMAITGEHWSSRWWANQADLNAGAASDAAEQALAAADAANEAADNANTALAGLKNTYYGAFSSAPSTDPSGGAVGKGDLYFDTTLNQLMVWNGSAWAPVTTASGTVTAGLVSFLPGGGISSTNVQAALLELDTEKLFDSPHDGGVYGRQNGNWVATTNPTIDWTQITGKPSTFPPSSHTHPQSEVTGLVAALAGKANTSDLTAETSSRIAGDNTNATNLSTETTNRQNADTTLQSNIDGVSAALSTETSQRIAADNALSTSIGTKIGDAPTDGQQYARQNAGWTPVVGGALVSATPPSSPLDGSLWWESDFGGLYIRYNDGNSVQWVQVNYQPAMDTLVKKAGDTMTGNLILDPPSGGINVTLDAPVGSSNQVVGSRGGNARWAVTLGGPVAESGSNTGSDFGVARFNDAGTFLDTPLTIYRNTGHAAFAASVGVGIVIPSAVTPAQTTFANSFSTIATYEFNSYLDTTPQRRALSTGFIGYLNLNPSTGAFSLGTSNASVAKDAVNTAFTANASWQANGTVYGGYHLMATDAIRPGTPTLSVYSVALGSCEGWQLNGAAGTLANYSMDGNGVGSGSPKIVLARSGWTSGGPAANMGLYEASQLRICAHDGVYYNDFSTVSGNWVWVQNSAQTWMVKLNADVDTPSNIASKQAAGSWIARSSDLRIKRDIRDYTRGLADILKIMPRVYKFRPETHYNDIDKDIVGLIAQEFQQVMPEDVFPVAKDTEIGEFSTTVSDLLTLDITNITYALINAVKELTARLEALEAR